MKAKCIGIISFEDEQKITTSNRKGFTAGCRRELHIVGSRHKIIVIHPQRRRTIWSIAACKSSGYTENVHPVSYRGVVKRCAYISVYFSGDIKVTLVFNITKEGC